MKLASCCASLAVFLGTCLLFAESENSAISFSSPTAILQGSEPGPAERAWNRLPAQKRQAIEQALLLRLGLSSTGRIVTLGCYTLPQACELGEKGDPVFHFMQEDLQGRRFVWACLLNSQAMKIQVLYRVNDADAFGQILNIASK